ncbi:hypothetical protein GCM10025771_19000 [Niveibacterium umoris]|uniref:GNAT superfamily N-acetyltransferase n=1 Tax=Niveibacterium umoris TaxID=1193620 RepID=A0A840BH84_9RHOO|nr:GNAT family N-acetyltransferase [Niveibacterium umoris]MBB4012911.1 GNAT superfamily N-acetyltransferase [Niveibacterium umoris]
MVRAALGSDAATIAGLYHQLTGNPDVCVSATRIADVNARGDTRLFVVEQAGHICGTLLVSLCHDVMFGSQPFGVVENVVIAAPYQGQGLGTQLMAAAEAFCHAADCSKLMLMSSVRRPEAHAFFKRCGFAGDAKRAFVKYRPQFQTA